MNRETFQVAMDALRANKMRAFLTMLGVVIGSASIVLVVTVALSGKQYILDQIEGIGSNIVYAKFVREGPLISTLADEISLADMEAVRAAIPAVVETAGTRGMAITVVSNGAERPVELVGVTEGFQRVRKLVLLQGRMLDPDDFAGRSKVCVVTDELALRMFPNEEAIGKEVRIGEMVFTVVGVFRERISTFGQSEIKKVSALVPFPVMAYFGEAHFVRTLYAQAERPELVAGVTRQMRETLESRHRPGTNYEVENLTSLLQAAANISLALTIILLLVAFIALLISGIGIMNIMLVTVTQRTREIGIRKAIGAPRREILWQFLMEAVMISGTGALVGILLAVGLQTLARRFVPGNLAVPISGVSVFVAFTVSCLTGAFFGYLPANRASKLPPTESLRYE
jgi:putative ABC transport system permease protein